MKKDYCSWFPEKWVVWVSPIKWKVVSIADCCEIHDENCSTSQFCKCLREKKAVLGLAITLGGMIGCIVKYPVKMWKRM